MEKTLVPGKTYTVTTASECAVTDSNGLVLCTATAGEQKAFVATTTTITFSDDSAAVTAVFKGAPALGGSGGSGGGGTPGTPAGFGEVTATATSLAAGSTPTASVETSGFNTAKNFAFSFGIPQGEKGEKGDKGDTGLTSEQISILTNYAASEGQNVSIGSDGTFTTQVGHTYVVTAESSVTVTQGDVTLNISAGTQQGFVATGTTATVSPTTCTVTEVFRAAATVALGGTSGGGIEGDYLTYDANGVVTGGRMNEVTDISYMFRDVARQTEWNIPLPKVTNAAYAFYGSGLTSFAMTLPEVTNADRMFFGTKSLVDVDISLPKATVFSYFLYTSTAQSVKIDAAATTNLSGICRSMPNLTTLHVIAPKCNDIGEICSASPKVSDFYWDGGVILKANLAFNGCVLNKESVLRIMAALYNAPPWASGTHLLTLGIAAEWEGDADIAAAIEAATANQWKITVQYN